MKYCIQMLSALVLGLSASLLFADNGASKEQASSAQAEAVLAYHVDLRVQILPLKALKAMAKHVAGLGFNTLLMEWEATYPFAEHRIISNRYAYSRAELKEFIAYAEGLGLDVIPLQQSLGHMEYVLRHERYAYLRADTKDFSQVDPTRLEQARELFTEIYTDIIASHDSPYVHIGGDETALLDCERCREAWGTDDTSKGKSKIYVAYMKMISDIVVSLNKTPLIWSDMILAHPEAIPDMPKDVIYVDWNYGWAVDRFGSEPKTLIDKHKLNFWGATAVRSWPDDYSVNTWRTHMFNQRDYVEYAKQLGFSGMVLTSWSTSGQYSYRWFDNEVVELFPIRQVYPHSYPDNAFRMTTMAFVESVNKDSKLKPEEFAIDYAENRFGLSRKQAEKLWKIMSAEELHQRNSVGSNPLSGDKFQPQNSIDKQLSMLRKFQSQLQKMKVRQNLQEFKHFQMQVDLREIYLRFRKIEQVAQASGLKETTQQTLVKQLKALRLHADVLRQEFDTLFAESLHSSELDQLHEYRTKAIDELYYRLARQR